MRVTDLEDLYELSPAQQGILFHSVQSPGSSVYTTQSLWSMRGTLDVAAFRKSWQIALDRHPALRSGVYWEDLDTPQQAVFRGLRFPFDEADWRDRSSAGQQLGMQHLVEEDRCRGFHLNHPPLARVALRRFSDDSWQCLWSRHHILFDGWSQAVVLRDVFTAYAAGGDGSALQAVVPYAAYIGWLRRQDRSRSEHFWRRMLAALKPTPLHAAGVHRRSSAASSAPRQESVHLSSEDASALTRLLRPLGVTLTSFALGLWALLLSRLTGAADVVFGLTVSGRPATLPGIESMVGLFINTLPLRVTLAPDRGFAELLLDIMARQSEIAEYSYCSLVDIQSWSGMPRGRPLFESVVVAENYPKPDPVMAAGCGLELSDFRSYVQNNYPLTLRVSAVDRCEFQLLFDSSRVAQGVVPVLLTQLQALLRKAPDLMAGRISAAVEIIHTAEQEQCRTAGRSILSDIRRRKENWNQTVEKSECTRSV